MIPEIEKFEQATVRKLEAAKNLLSGLVYVLLLRLGDDVEISPEEWQKIREGPGFNLSYDGDYIKLSLRKESEEDGQ